MRYIISMLLFLPFLVSAQNRPDTITNEKVIKMVKSGLSDILIMKSVTSAKFQRLDLSSDGLIELKRNKVSDSLILVLFEKSSSNATPYTTTQSSYTAITGTKKAQSASSTIDPSEFSKLLPGFYVRNHLNGKLTRLYGIKSSIQIGANYSPLGGRAKWFYDFAGTSAQIKINNPQPEFFMVIGANQSNTVFEPSRFVVINVEQKKGKRKIELDNGLFGTKSLGGPSSFSERDGMIKPVFIEYTENVFKVSFEKKLPDGNYFFAPAQIVREQSMEFFEFDIQSKN
jgi:hypothetical protein